MRIVAPTFDVNVNTDSFGRTSGHLYPQHLKRFWCRFNNVNANIAVSTKGHTNPPDAGEPVRARAASAPRRAAVVSAPFAFL
jgi:hypothetical protein